MSTRIILPGAIILFAGLLFPGLLSAQRGDVTIPTGASISVPLGAQICADRFYANNPGYGTLTLADPSGICAGAIVTPVELLTFSASLQDGRTLLSWTTATETRCYGFEVQRNTGQDVWAPCGFVEGHGSTTAPHSYGFPDDLTGLPTSPRVLRYRLKQIDLDGRFEYSPEVEVRLDAPLPRFALEGFPSPCDETLTVHLTLEDAGTTSLRLYDLAGRVVTVIARNVQLSSGYHTLQARTAEIPSGIYLLAAEGDNDSRTVKVVIRH